MSKKNRFKVLKLEQAEVTPLQIEVDGDFEGACRRFKSLVQKERIIGQIKEKMAYEKPSDKKRKKRREAVERQMILELKHKLMVNGDLTKFKTNKHNEKIARKLKKEQEEGNLL